MIDYEMYLVRTVAWETLWPRIPLYVVWLFGLAVAWRRRREHPRISRVASLALAGFLLYDALGTFLGIVLAAKARSSDWSRESLEVTIQSLEVVGNCVVAYLWVLVLDAIFGSRQQQATSRPEPDALPTTPRE